MTQKPRTFESDPQSAMQLVCADTFFTGANKVHCGQPIAHSDMTVLENGPDLHGERLAASVAFVKANPIAFAFKRCGALEHAAMRANAAIRPNARLDIGVSGGFLVEVRGSENGPGHGKLLIESTISDEGGHVKYNIAFRKACGGTRRGFGLRDETGSTIAKGFGEVGAPGAAPRTWAAFQAMISDSLKYRRAPMINGRGKLRSGRTTQLKIVRGATLNSLATAGLVINLSGCIRKPPLGASAS
jgi:hypothetical protein